MEKKCKNVSLCFYVLDFLLGLSDLDLLERLLTCCYEIAQLTVENKSVLLTVSRYLAFCFSILDMSLSACLSFWASVCFPAALSYSRSDIIQPLSASCSAALLSDVCHLCI